MEATNRDKQLYGNEVEIVRRDDDCTIYRINNSKGDAVITSYSVFPGIELIYNDVHTQWVSIDGEQPKNILEINHCKEGIIECENRKGEYLYISKGNLAINQKYNMKNSCNFPLNHFHGITVAVDLDKIPNWQSSVLEDVSVNLLELKNKFCENSKGFLVIRENQSIEHIFSELYSVSEKIRKGYYKVKMLELFLFLSSLEQEDLVQSKKYYPKTQVDIIKAIKEYLIIHLSEKITLDQLSVQFQIPLTTMKIVFKEIYGDSIYSFIRTYKMQKAAELLKNTNEDINVIAGSLGYDNASKFSEAFKKVIGLNPSIYRKNV
ncbi:regulatory protein PchR [Clostridium saccharobutylicum]|uniref:helix-turn-helix domain-containing protein n=1 Tax=Clostridium saccharobutylicum TaxID=169679 RepID=UPI000983E899|nr:AraC family transcriptional regulator [Clostridium saccharobutylicum]AQS09629.1 regulatory protein PchR [Clostridium saccharobutylicum]MBC2436135.1 helix-turn-helix transcriptional regulator [Clostridium saccharobutylicum]NSB88071.1 AraC-like DNA-binding protein [Clostridium saccharobutylicum]NYC27981.1 AraC-like DNA-binding protein [Clostridium saccharobutylicum]OOM15252.1 regulatory protein PchR [Clostridium saccharobutylicum]